MAHILVAGKLHPAGIERLKAAQGMTFTLVDEISLESYLPHVAEADAVVMRTQPMTAEVVAAAPQLKIVSRHGVGYDAVDVKALSARHIPLAIVGDVNSRAVAEHTLMLMLAVARKAAQHDAAIHRGEWNVRNRFETVELDGKSLLLVGFGRIGRRVAELARAFGMTVAAYDPFVKPDAMAKHGVRPAADLVKALADADYVSLHMPGSTAGAVIFEEEINAMKPGAILINAARGGLVDEVLLVGDVLEPLHQHGVGGGVALGVLGLVLQLVHGAAELVQAVQAALGQRGGQALREQRKAGHKE